MKWLDHAQLNTTPLPGQVSVLDGEGNLLEEVRQRVSAIESHG